MNIEKKRSPLQRYLEVSRNQLIAQSRGNDRYQRKNKSSIGSSSTEYNKVNMDKLFKEDILEANVPVKGETDNYVVSISYEGVIEHLKLEIKKNNNQLDLRCCVQALTKAFNKADVYFKCTCKDWQYRMGYWATVKGYINLEPETRPSRITNPNNTLGSGCKHSLLVLSRTLWILKLASVLHNYIKYMQKVQKRLYDKIMVSKLYDEVPEEVDKSQQISMFDDEPEEEKAEEPVSKPAYNNSKYNKPNVGEQEDGEDIEGN